MPLFAPIDEEFWEVERSFFVETEEDRFKREKAAVPKLTEAQLQKRKERSLFEERKRYYRDEYNLDLVYESKPILNELTGNYIHLAVLKVRW